MAGEEPSGFRMVDPYPGGPKRAYQERFGMPRRDVNDEVRDVSFRDRLEMGTDRIDVHTVHELSGRFQYVPGLDHEFLQVAAGLLGLH